MSHCQSNPGLCMHDPECEDTSCPGRLDEFAQEEFAPVVRWYRRKGYGAAMAHRLALWALGVEQPIFNPRQGDKHGTAHR